MKNIALGFTVAFCSLFIAFLLYGSYDSYWSLKARLGYRNQQNIKKVKLGMTEFEVTRIMGKPAFINRIDAVPQTTQYTFQMPPGSSKNCDVKFDRSGRVIYTYCSPK